jgi:hypothetical protein
VVASARAHCGAVALGGHFLDGIGDDDVSRLIILGIDALDDDT